MTETPVLAEKQLNELREIVSDILGVDPAQITLETGTDTLEQWDSLATLSIVTAVEEKFGVRFAMEEIQHIRSVGALMDALAARLTA